MSQNYLRYCSIIANGVGSIDLSTLRCRFNITQATMQAPNLMKLMVTNPLPQMAQQFVKKEFQNITVDAGYQSNHGIIFQGKIVFRSLGARARPTRCSRSGPRTATRATITRWSTRRIRPDRRRNSISTPRCRRSGNMA